MQLKFLSILFACFALSALSAQERADKFKQLEEILPTPNTYRTASGAPGHQYWQQQADYVMNIRLDEDAQRIYGDETITYTNNSPDALSYLWLQLDQNQSAKDGDAEKIETSSITDKMSPRQLNGLTYDFDGGFKIDYVQDVTGKALPYTVNKTMMRIDLPMVLKTGAKYSFKIKWWNNINDRIKLGGRAGYEHFAEENNTLYTIATFFPRMCVYGDNTGWQHKQFLGQGEFTLTFGNYDVKMTVPSDHVLGATGVLQNPTQVLSATQISRLASAKNAKEPVIIVTEKEARDAEKSRSKQTKTWHFKAENVRDFAFATSRKFIWDAVGVPQSDGRVVMAMSYYPKEGNPLWEQYSTKAVAHTLKWYSNYTFDYPYPTAISVHTDQIGMEYPMICFNGGRPEKDGTYSDRVKYGMISVIIHEVGHNYFPMIVNSDERQWSWMDEGLNSFLEFLAEQQWERDYPSRRGPVRNMVDYMKGDKSRLEPIMTNSESIIQFGNNAYGKPATALNILRETVMGRELFDHAFKTYSTRWKFKHPSPSDFFRTMEDASAVDLDWFWRGWFYGTEPCDIALKNVRWFKADTKDPDVENARKKDEKAAVRRSTESIFNEKNIAQTQDEKDKKLRDYYSDDDVLAVTKADRDDYQKYLATLTDDEKKVLQSGKNYYEITFENVGGLVMPLIVEFEYTDGTRETERIPAEIWKQNQKTVTKVFVKTKEVRSIALDPQQETADIDLNNNTYPAKPQISRFELFKQRPSNEMNAMQKAKKN
jgi:Peptidase family M1 domain